MKFLFQVVLVLGFAIACGAILAVIYSLFSSFIFDKNGFGHSRINELILYLFTLIPPFIFCWMKFADYKSEGLKKKADAFLLAGIVYVAGGFIFLLVSTNFYILSGS